MSIPHSRTNAVRALAPFLSELLASTNCLLFDTLKHCKILAFCNGTFKGQVVPLKVCVKAHCAQTNRTLTLCTVYCTRQLRRSILNKVFQNIVKHTHQIRNKHIVILPGVVFFQVYTRKTTYCGTASICRKCDFRAKIRVMHL